MQNNSWIINSELDGIDIDPSNFGSSIPLKKVPNGDVLAASQAGDLDRLRYLLESGVNVNAQDSGILSPFTMLALLAVADRGGREGGKCPP
ncbi:hypothetical protein K1719_035768 [Acacia pycnantha]|nr:hypothetical protein K1719_035768 [Acacia pycnantha]